MPTPERLPSLRKRFSNRLGTLQKFAYFMMASGAHLVSLEDDACAELVTKVEPAIRSALRSQEWTRRPGRGTLSVKPKTLTLVKPHITQLVATALIIQLDILVHQTFNDVRGEPGNDTRFEEDLISLLGNAREGTLPFAVAHSEKCRDIVLLSMLRNLVVHRQDAGHGLLTKPLPGDGDRPRLTRYTECLLESVKSAKQTSVGWRGIHSTSETRIVSKEQAIRWCQDELAHIAQKLAYDDYFRFSGAAKVVLNKAISLRERDR